ncbi:hypothetical protein B0H14DRAFT_153236 [Mycena olivaceomarginata]|nr:hypothetical protein B0H14DRAFT_153236 [Mycena olivaceomarginata]
MRVYSMCCLTRLCLAPERSLAGCLRPGPGVISSLGFSTSCGRVRRASAGRSRLGICSPPPRLPRPASSARTHEPQRQRPSLGTRVRIRAAVQDLARRIIVCVRAHPSLPADACVMSFVSWHPLHDERWTCVPRHHPRTSAPATVVSYTGCLAPAGRVCRALPSPCPLRSPGIGSCVPGRRAPHEHVRARVGVCVMRPMAPACRVCLTPT